MGNCARRNKGEVDKPHEEKGESENTKAPEVVDASTQVTPDNVSIASCHIPLPEKVTTTERDDNNSNASAVTTCSLVGEETAKNIKQN